MTRDLEEKIISSLDLNEAQVKKLKVILKKSHRPGSRVPSIISMAVSGKYNRDQIAEKLGISYTYVCNVLRRNKINIKRKEDVRTDSVRNKDIARKVETGVTLLEISKEYNISRERARQIAAKQGVVSLRIKIVRDKIKAIKVDINKGVTLSEACSKHSMSITTFKRNAPEFHRNYIQSKKDAKEARLKIGLELVKEGASIRTSARTLKLTEDELGEYCSLNGVKSRFKSRWGSQGRLERKKK